MKILGSLLAFALIAAPGVARAEYHEFFGCTFKEGHGMADFDKWVPKWKAVVDKLKMKDQFRAEILTPRYDAESDLPDFFFMDAFPDGTALGSALSEYLDGGAGDAVTVELNKFATCKGSLWIGRKIYGK